MRVYIFILFIVINQAVSEKQPIKRSEKLYKPKLNRKCSNIKCSPVAKPECIKVKNKKQYNHTMYIIIVNRCELQYMKCHEGFEASIVPMKHCRHGVAPSLNRTSNMNVKRGILKKEHKLSKGHVRAKRDVSSKNVPNDKQNGHNEYEQAEYAPNNPSEYGQPDNMPPEYIEPGPPEYNQNEYQQPDDRLPPYEQPEYVQSAPLDYIPPENDQPEYNQNEYQQHDDRPPQYEQPDYVQPVPPDYIPPENGQPDYNQNQNDNGHPDDRPPQYDLPEYAQPDPPEHDRPKYGQVGHRQPNHGQPEFDAAEWETADDGIGPEWYDHNIQTPKPDLVFMAVDSNETKLVADQPEHDRPEYGPAEHRQPNRGQAEYEEPEFEIPDDTQFGLPEYDHNIQTPKPDLVFMAVDSNETRLAASGDVQPDEEEYDAACPKVCPSRSVMVCAKCRHGVYRTFISVCHMRMFSCKHKDDALELVSRFPCVLSAPLISEKEMQPRGKVVLPEDEDKILKYIICRERAKLGRYGKKVKDGDVDEGDPRCREFQLRTIPWPRPETKQNEDEKQQLKYHTNDYY